MAKMANSTNHKSVTSNYLYIYIKVFMLDIAIQLDISVRKKQLLLRLGKNVQPSRRET